MHGTKDAALKNTDALIIVTEWQSFRALDFLSRQFRQPLIFDGRNLFDPQRRRSRGFYRHFREATDSLGVRS
ncbi:UDP binding domain-containing protein [Pseudomonas sp. ANT_J28]|uniref:UDP binding domain-containing protein n=1 Tax=Pseudomonas sp. ANT_J28 TaxID=2597352 RepID=UPI00353265B4